MGHALDENLHGRSEENNVSELIVEATLVLDGARDDHSGLRGAKRRHTGFAPGAVGEYPSVVVGVHGPQTTTLKLSEHRLLTGP